MVRAIAIATDRTWDEVHWDLCMLSHERCTMPSVNWLWELYLKQNGFKKFLLPDSCPECITVREFARRFPEGTYVIGTGSHAVCVTNGHYIDSWDSGDETPTYFFKRSE